MTDDGLRVGELAEPIPAFRLVGDAPWPQRIIALVDRDEVKCIDAHVVFEFNAPIRREYVVPASPDIRSEEKK